MWKCRSVFFSMVRRIWWTVCERSACFARGMHMLRHLQSFGRDLTRVSVSCLVAAFDLAFTHFWATMVAWIACWSANDGDGREGGGLGQGPHRQRRRSCSPPS